MPRPLLSSRFLCSNLTVLTEPELWDGPGLGDEDEKLNPCLQGDVF